MRIGNYQLTAIETGTIALDGGAMFGVVPKPLWERQLPADARNRVRLAVRALLLEEVDGPARILVDTGAGTKWSAKHADMFAVETGQFALERSLAQRGLTTAAITDVLLTHLHFDHAGGATRRRGEAVVPTFENARYWVQRRNWDWALQPTMKDRASYREENFLPLQEHGVLEFLDGPGLWRPGIELSLSEGHTTAMQLPLVSGPQGHLFYCADLVPTAAHVQLPWVMGYDNHPLTTIEEKQALLERACEGHWVLFFEHDPIAAAAHVRRKGNGFEAAERVAL